MKPLKAILGALRAFFAFILPIAKNTAEKVAPDIQREIDRILGEARSRVDGLKANHSLASIQKQMDDDIAAVRETAEHHVKLITQLARSKMIDTNKLLPDVAAQLAGAGPAGPSPSDPAKPLDPPASA